MTTAARSRSILLAAFCALGACHGPLPPDEEIPRAAPPVPETPPPTPPEGPLGLAQAMDFALKNAPAIRTVRARAEAARIGVDVAGTAYLPRLDLLWQSVRATRNNISGQFFPQSVVPPISGPVSPKSWDHAWGATAGALASWEPFDFGLRSSQMELARAVARQAGSEVELSRLDAALGAAEAFLVLVAAEEAARAARANVERWDVFARSVKALVDQQLRPGVDASRAEAELALARTQEIQAAQAVEGGKATFAEALGLRTGDLRVDPGPVLTVPALADLPRAGFVSHPLLARQAAVVQTLEARKSVVDNSYGPRVNLQLSFSDRGSGFGPSGQVLDPEDGLWPDRYNWVAGVTLTLPLMDYFGLEARGRQEEALARSERSRTDEILLALSAQERRVRSYFDAARKIAENTPVQLKAAREAQARSRSRYDSGLGTLTEVAETQRLLAQAEIDDALAHLGIWRALTAASRVQGDLQPLLEIVARTKKEK